MLVRATDDQPDAANASPIIGDWYVTTINATPVIADSAATMTFGADGALVGNASCNSYSTRYTATASGLSLNSAVATTLMACDPATDQQERAFLEVLHRIAADDGASRFELDDTGNRLTLTSSDGATIDASRCVDMSDRGRGFTSR